MQSGEVPVLSSRVDHPVGLARIFLSGKFVDQARTSCTVLVFKRPVTLPVHHLYYDAYQLHSDFTLIAAVSSLRIVVAARVGQGHVSDARDAVLVQPQRPALVVPVPGSARS